MVQAQWSSAEAGHVVSMGWKQTGNNRNYVGNMVRDATKPAERCVSRMSFIYIFKASERWLIISYNEQSLMEMRAGSVADLGFRCGASGAAVGDLPRDGFYALRTAPSGRDFRYF